MTSKLNLVVVSCFLISVAEVPDLVSGGEALGIGLGYGSSSRPYADALQRLRDNGVTVLKTWNINPDWLDAVQTVYSDVSFWNQLDKSLKPKTTVSVPEFIDSL